MTKNNVYYHGVSISFLTSFSETSFSIWSLCSDETHVQYIKIYNIYIIGIIVYPINLINPLQ